MKRTKRYVRALTLAFLTVCLAVSARTVSMAQEPSPPPSGTQCAVCQWLYFATNFNAFIFGDLTPYGGDCEARIAVGGTFTFENSYSVGYPVVGEPLPTFTNGLTDMLIVGGDLHDDCFGVNGNIVYGGTRYGPTRYPSNGNLVYHATNITFDAADGGNVSRDGTGKTWAELYAIVAAASARMAALEERGVVSKNLTQRYSASLTGSDPSLNVFHVSAQEWSKTSARYTIEAPEGSTVLINIHGGDVAITNGGMTLVGIERGRVIYNYVDATHIATKSFSHHGSLLAPYASGTFSGGSIDGYAVFGGTVESSNGFEFHNFPFKGGCFDGDSHLLGSIGNYVWEDLNGNGIQESGEASISNVVMRLTDIQGNELDTMLTDAAGFYTFTNLSAGTYLVQALRPSGCYTCTIARARAGTRTGYARTHDGYVRTPAGDISPDDHVDSDGDEFGWSLPIQLGAGEHRTDIDFGFYRLARLYGYVYHDADNSLTRNTGDKAVVGMSVQLWRDGAQVAATNAAADGFYEFCGLTPGACEVIFICSTNALTAVPEEGSDAAGNPERNRAVAVEHNTATTSYTLYSGHGVDGGDPGEPVNAGFTGTGTMSSGIDLQAYQGADGVYVEFVAHDVEEDGEITLSLLGPDGGPLWYGSVAVEAGSESICRFRVPGLEVGCAYDFALRDEVGQLWKAYDVEVKPFAAEMIRMSLAEVTLSFESLPEREYAIQWTPRLGDPWQTVATVFSEGRHTTVVVPHPDRTSPSGFFRIVLQ
ncbi:MAG: choice-of-anchor A family protein [Kiritimatiellia bacterium]